MRKRLTENQLRRNIRAVLISEMDIQPKVVTEGILSDIWEKTKAKAKDMLDIETEESIEAKVQKANPQFDKAAGEAAKAIKEAGTEDAWKMYLAVKGLGTDEGAAQEVFAKRNKDLKKLSEEFSELLNNIDNQLKLGKSAWEEIKSGAKTGAMVGAGVQAAWIATNYLEVILTSGDPMRMISLMFRNPVTLLQGLGQAMLVMAGIGGAIGAASQAFKNVLGLKIDSSKTLAQVLDEEGLDEMAKQVEAAVSGGVKAEARRMLESSRTYRKIKWRG